MFAECLENDSLRKVLRGAVLGLMLMWMTGCAERTQAEDNPDTRLIAALKEGSAEKARKALDEGANPNAKEGASHERLSPFDTSSYRTALMLAGNNRLPDIVTLLLQKGARINERDRQGDTALHWSLRGKSRESCEILLANSADIEARGANELSPLSLAANEGNVHMVQRLLKAGAKVDAADRAGHAALMGAADAPTARLLLGAGADINARGGMRRTPLMMAVNAGEPALELITLLIRRKADVNVVAEHGETALRVAYAHGASHREIVRLLKEAGAKK